MRGGWVVLLLVIPAMSGCTTSESGGFFDFLTGGATLDGPCGHVYNENWEKQIIIQIQWTKDTAGKVSPTALEVDAIYHGKGGDANEREVETYSTKFADSKGCVAFPLQDEGGYSFWAFAETDTAFCYVDGRTSGTFNGQEVVGATLTIDRYFGADHC